MKKAASLIATAALALSAIAAAPAQQAREFDHNETLPLDDTVVTVDGGVPGGVNPNYFDIAPGTVPGGTCDQSPTNYCELIEVTFDTTGLHAVDDGGTPEDDSDDVVQDLSIFGSIKLKPTQPVADFDLDVYWLNDDGTDGDQIGQSGNAPVADTDADGYDENVPLNLTIDASDEGEHRFVVKVVYFAAPSTYTVDMKAMAF